MITFSQLQCCYKPIFILVYFVSFYYRLKLYYDHGEIKRYSGKRRMADLKAFVDQFVVTSEVNNKQ